MERRKFVKLLAAGGAAVLAGAAPRARAKTPPPQRRAAAQAHRLPSAALEKEIRAQKKSLDETLRLIRGYELPPGSPPAVVFRAMRARRDR
ncbi:MAG TPA: twin-arginine translocation signal domain-containing protein [Candidatus Eisenbacteria bacterium]|jgi:hypothetical protein